MNARLMNSAFLVIGITLGLFLNTLKNSFLVEQMSLRNGFDYLVSYLSEEEKELGIWDNSEALSIDGLVVVKTMSLGGVTNLWILPESEPYYPQTRMAMDSENIDIVVYDSEVKSVTFESSRASGRFNFYSFSPLINPNADSVVDADVDGEYDVVLNLNENKLKLARIDGEWHELGTDSVGLFVDIEGDIKRVLMREGKCYFGE